MLIIGNSAWYLEARPSIQYVMQGENTAIACYNISTNASITSLPQDSQWYKIASDHTLKLMISDGNLLRIFSASNTDNGSYCCKESDTVKDIKCDERATATLQVVTPPSIVSGPNRTVSVGNNVTLECIIRNEGTPAFVVYRWQKSEQRLVTDGMKYISRLNEDRSKMVLIVIESNVDDEGYYQCVLETPAFQRIKKSVYLSLDHANIPSVPMATMTSTSTRSYTYGHGVYFLYNCTCNMSNH